MIAGHGRPVVRPRRSALALMSFSLGAKAQSGEAPYPSRAVRFIVPAAPSRPTDV